MFLGSIPGDLRKIISEYVKDWRCQDVFVGCSGNLTVERVLASHGKFRIHGNDVSIYTCCLGSYFAQQSFRLDVIHDEFQWLAEYMYKPADQLATMMLATRLAELLGKTTPYHQRMMDAYITQWPTMHAQTTERITKATLSLESFFCGDVLDFVQNATEDVGFITFPPFWKGGYERMWKKLGTLFDWDESAYTVLDESYIDTLFQQVTNRPHWIISANRQLDDYADYLRGSTQTSARGVTMYVYASSGKSRITKPTQKVEPVKTPHLTPGQELGERLGLAPLTQGQFNALRAAYIHIPMAPAGVQQAIAVTVDGVIIGAYGLVTPNSFAGFSITEPYLYMMSDFAVSPTDYPRLSKLVLYAVLSREAQQLMQRFYSRRVRSLVTTAFAKNPVSMKYRGLFRLLSRKETDDGYALNYGAEVGQWTLADGFEIWKKKHGNKNHHG